MGGIQKAYHEFSTDFDGSQRKRMVVYPECMLVAHTYRLDLVNFLVSKRSEAVVGLGRASARFRPGLTPQQKFIFLTWPL